VKHLTENEIALFVDGRFEDIDDHRVAGHLRECDSCRADYQDAVRGKGRWIVDREQFQPGSDLVDAGVAAVHSMQSGRPGLGRPGRNLRLLAVAAAVVVVVSVATFWFAVDNGGDAGSILDQAVEPVRRAAIEVSSHAEFVLPRTEDFFRPDLPVYRSNLTTDDESLTSALIHLTDKKNAGLDTRDDQFWLVAGFVAANQLDEAESCVNDALRDYPGDGEFMTLAAVIAQSTGDYVTAERLLQEVLRRDPGDATVRLNLAVVLMKQGNRPRAEDHLRRVLGDRPNTRLAERAELLLE
jgi:tetratricopeptide (TPR) repeat protein